MTNKIEVNIDLPKLADIAHVGVRRAVLFMGLGLNGINQPGFRDYQLHKLPVQTGQQSLPVDFFPPNLPDERVATFKQEFSVWIAGCGLRELLEHYALYLDHIHNYGLVVQQATGKLGPRDPKKEQRSFNRNGSLAEKLKLLKERFGIEIEAADSITQLYSARNCLTHDLGVVAPTRCDSQGVFAVTWTAFDMLAIGDETGAERPLADLIASGERTQENTTVAMRRVVRRRELKAGDKLRFTQQDLWEQCFFFNAIAIPMMMTAFVAYLTAHGIGAAAPDTTLPKAS